MLANDGQGKESHTAGAGRGSGTLIFCASSVPALGTENILVV